MILPKRDSRQVFMVLNMPRTFLMAFSACPLLWLSYLAPCSSPAPSHSMRMTRRASRTKLTNAFSLSLFTITLECDNHEIAWTTRLVEYPSASTPLLGTANAKTDFVLEHFMMTHFTTSPSEIAARNFSSPSSFSAYPSSLSSCLLPNFAVVR